MARPWCQCLPLVRQTCTSESWGRAYSIAADVAEASAHLRLLAPVLLVVLSATDTRQLPNCSSLFPCFQPLLPKFQPLPLQLHEALLRLAQGHHPQGGLDEVCQAHWLCTGANVGQDGVPHAQAGGVIGGLFSDRVWQNTRRVWQK